VFGCRLECRNLMCGRRLNCRRMHAWLHVDVRDLRGMASDIGESIVLLLARQDRHDMTTLIEDVSNKLFVIWPCGHE